MASAAAAVRELGGNPFIFSSRRPKGMEGVLWIDPATLVSAQGTAQALAALADFDAFSAAMKAFLINLLGQQIADQPLEGRDGQPTRLGGDLAHAATVSEVALLLGTSEAAAARAVNFSDALVDIHPTVHEALLSGDTTEAHVKAVVDQAATLPAEAAEAFGVEALGRLYTRKGQRRTPGEFRTVIRALRERLHPESITERRSRAAADRGVWLRPEDDGMCTLTALLPAEAGFAVYQQIDVTARSARSAEGEHRTIGQLRADALAQAVLQTVAAGTKTAGVRPGLPKAQGMLGTPGTSGTLGAPGAPGASEASGAPGTLGAPGALGAARTPGTPPAAQAPVPVPAPVPIPEDLAELVRAEIVVHIPAAVLLGASDDVAQLEGFGVIDAHTARELASAAPTWQRLWVDDEGVPLKLGRGAYRPPDSLKRFIRYRDGTCLVPGCTCAARRTEVDHTIEWQDGGTTDAENLALLCSKHHALKSLALFMLRQPAGGVPARSETGESEGPVSQGVSGERVWTTLLGLEYPAEALDRAHVLGARPALAAAEPDAPSGNVPAEPSQPAPSQPAPSQPAPSQPDTPPRQAQTPTPPPFLASAPESGPKDPQAPGHSTGCRAFHSLPIIP